MTKEREALKLALEAQQAWERSDVTAYYKLKALEQILKKALAQPEQEPAFKPFEIETSIEEDGEIHQTITDLTGKVVLHVLDTQEAGVRSALIEMGWTPPQRTWVGLTDEEWQEIADKYNLIIWSSFKQEIEAKLKEKNT